MARLILVRHGEAAAGYGDDLDPGLSPLGQAQANAAAEALGPLGVLPILVSPMRRTQETAAPLASQWGVAAVIEERVSEIKAPSDALEERQAWIRTALGGSWSDLEPEAQAFADGVASFFMSIATDTVVFTHFVAINVAIGRATGDDRVMARRVGNCSRTVVSNDGGTLTLLEEPIEVDTEVL